MGEKAKMLAGLGFREGLKKALVAETQALAILEVGLGPT